MEMVCLCVCVYGRRCSFTEGPAAGGVSRGKAYLPVPVVSNEVQEAVHPQAPHAGPQTYMIKYSIYLNSVSRTAPNVRPLIIPEATSIR